MSEHKSGMVALIGRPNVGKSTLVNLFVGHKVSIVSDKPQTTRRRALGILSEPEFQIVFVDTPGMHEPHTRLGKLLNESAETALDGVDAVLVVVDSSKRPGPEDEAIAAKLEATGWLNPGSKLLLCLNKMDRLKAEFVVEHTELYCKLFRTESYMLTSLTKRQNTDLLLSMLVELLPEGPPLYPEDEFTDQPMRFIAAELVREKALRLTRQEVPHAIATVVDEWEEEEDGRVRVAVSIVVEKQGQKAILIGKGGTMLKKIGQEARLELNEMLGARVHLELFVKVREEWRQNRRDKVQSQKARREAGQALEAAIADLEKRQAATRGRIRNGGLTAVQLQIEEQEVAYLENLLAVRRKQLVEVTTSGNEPEKTASSGEAHQMKLLFEDAADQLGEDFNDAIRLYRRASAERDIRLPKVASTRCRTRSRSRIVESSRSVDGPPCTFNCTCTSPRRCSASERSDGSRNREHSASSRL